MADSMEGLVHTDGSQKDDNTVDGLDATDRVVSGELRYYLGDLSQAQSNLENSCQACADSVFL